MPYSEYEIDIDDELWESAVRASGIRDPSELANLALLELLERVRARTLRRKAMIAGYSGTPLARKLGLKPGMRTWRDEMPPSVAAEIGEAGVKLLRQPEAPIDAAHIFVTERADVQTKLAALRPLLAPGGFIWVSWPKKASKVPTDITEDVIRAVILPTTDLVDVKVCAVDATWSGLKLMIRRSAR